MRAAAVNEIKEELKHICRPISWLHYACSCRVLKENKELLTFYFWSAWYTRVYRIGKKQNWDVQFENINSSVYFVKKSLRKMSATAAKYTRYSGDAVVETELLLHFCRLVNSMEKMLPAIPWSSISSKTSIKKIRAAIGSMHEDLQAMNTRKK